MNNNQQRYSTSGLGYSGNITVKIQKNDKIISVKKYHNAGTAELWQFISYCLAGKYQSAEALRPQYIKLFNNLNDPGKGLATNNILPASQAIMINTSSTPQIWTSEEDSSLLGYKTVLHFLIPYSFISDNNINEVRIYSKKNKDKDSACSAYFQFVTEDVAGNKNWDPLEIADTFNNYNLIIEWEMRVSNLAREENN